MIIKFIDSIKDISPTQWQTLFPDNPFSQYEFLMALEASQCTQSSSGWQPHHLVVIKSDTLIAAMPCFIKTHSYGEYVFDWAWADAYQQHGLNYYPKLVTAIPFTPSSGQRLAISDSIIPKAERNLVIQTVSRAIETELAQLGASSWHCLFPNKALSEAFAELSHTTRIGVQYHWHNKAYTSFDSFLAQLKSRKRKNIRRERQSVLQQGICFKNFEGEQITDELMSQFYRFYHMTYLKRSQRAGYLNLAFFLYLTKHMPEKLMMVCAYKDQQLIASALFFKSSKTLYGRYWGCEHEFDSLHFETCYYQGIEYCIEKNLEHFDPGAQGEHKIARGFEPVKTFSNHCIKHHEFKRAIDKFIDDETPHINQYINHLFNSSPYKQPIELST